MTATCWLEEALNPVERKQLRINALRAALGLEKPNL